MHRYTKEKERTKGMELCLHIWLYPLKQHSFEHSPIRGCRRAVAAVVWDLLENTSCFGDHRSVNDEAKRATSGTKGEARSGIGLFIQWTCWIRGI